MSKTLEYCLEEVGIQLCKRQDELQGALFVHYDNKERRKDNRVVVTARKGAFDPAGAKTWNCELSVEYVTPKQVSVEQADSVMAGIEKAFSLAAQAEALAIGLPAFSKFRFLNLLESGGDGNKENQDKHRVRSITVPCLAALL